MARFGLSHQCVAILLLQIFFQRTGVNADADRDVFIARAVDNAANTLFVTDIAGVDAQAIDAVLGDFQRNAIVKVDVRHQRDTHLLFDKPERFCRVHRRHRDTHDVCADAL